MRLLFTPWWHVINFVKEHLLCLWPLPLPGTTVFPIRACSGKGPVCLLMLELLQLTVVQSSLQKTRDQGLLWSTLRFTYPRGPAAFAEKPCAALSSSQPQNIRQGLVPSNSLSRWVSQGQGGHVGSSGSPAEASFFILTFFVFGAFLEWWEHKVNRKDRPLTTTPIPSLDWKRVTLSSECSATDVPCSNFPSFG